jgi:hypothetical protein
MQGLLSTFAAAQFLCVSPRTLERYRVTGGGPAFVKIGKRVAYNQGDLEAYTSTNKFRSTSEYTARCTSKTRPRVGNGTLRSDKT